MMGYLGEGLEEAADVLLADADAGVPDREVNEHLRPSGLLHGILHRCLGSWRRCLYAPVGPICSHSRDVMSCARVPQNS